LQNYRQKFDKLETIVEQKAQIAFNKANTFITIELLLFFRNETLFGKE